MEQRFLPGMSPGLVRVAEAAKRNPGRLLSLAHHIDVSALRRAYKRIRNDAAVGVDGVTKEQYGKDLEENLKDLHQRMKTMRYRHQPLRRVLIDKEGDKTRPIGISSLEDKIVQNALVQNEKKIWLRTKKGREMLSEAGAATGRLRAALDAPVNLGELEAALAEVEAHARAIDEETRKRSMVVT